MKIFPGLLGLIIFFGTAGALSADIYSWKDAVGIRHFSNHAPPKGVEVVSITSEMPYVEPSAEERAAAQQAEMLAEVQQKMAEWEAESS